MPREPTICTTKYFSLVRILWVRQQQSGVHSCLFLPSCKHPSLEHSFIGHDAINDSDGTFHVVLLHHNRPADPLGLLRQVLEQLGLNESLKLVGAGLVTFNFFID